MNNPEIQATKNEQSRDTGNGERTIQRYRQPRMNNPELQATQNEQSRDAGNNGHKHRKNTYKAKKMSITDSTETLG